MDEKSNEGESSSVDEWIEISRKEKSIPFNLKLSFNDSIMHLKAKVKVCFSTFETNQKNKKIYCKYFNGNNDMKEMQKNGIFDFKYYPFHGIYLHISDVRKNMDFHLITKNDHPKRIRKKGLVPGNTFAIYIEIRLPLKYKLLSEEEITLQIYRGSLMEYEKKLELYDKTSSRFVFKEFIDITEELTVVECD